MEILKHMEWFNENLHDHGPEETKFIRKEMPRQNAHGDDDKDLPHLPENLDDWPFVRVESLFTHGEFVPDPMASNQRCKKDVATLHVQNKGNTNGLILVDDTDQIAYKNPPEDHGHADRSLISINTVLQRAQNNRPTITITDMGTAVFEDNRISAYIVDQDGKLYQRSGLTDGGGRRKFVCPACKKYFSFSYKGSDNWWQLGKTYELASLQLRHKDNCDNGLVYTKSIIDNTFNSEWSTEKQNLFASLADQIADVPRPVPRDPDPNEVENDNELFNKFMQHIDLTNIKDDNNAIVYILLDECSTVATTTAGKNALFYIGYSSVTKAKRQFLQQNYEYYCPLQHGSKHTIFQDLSKKASVGTLTTNIKSAYIINKWKSNNNIYASIVARSSKKAELKDLEALLIMAFKVTSGALNIKQEPCKFCVDQELTDKKVVGLALSVREKILEDFIKNKSTDQSVCELVPNQWFRDFSKTSHHKNNHFSINCHTRMKQAK